jgi:hypothetical protein
MINTATIRKNMAFVGAVVSPSECLSDLRFSHAGNSYQLRAIRALTPSVIISLIPIFVRRGRLNPSDHVGIYIHNDLGREWRMLKGVRLIADTVEAVWVMWRAKTSCVCVYNVDLHNWLVIACALYVLRLDVVVIVADYVSERRGIMKWVIDRVLFDASGALVLNSNIKVNRRQIVMPGLSAERRMGTMHKCSSRRILFSGSLGRTTGLSLALNVGVLLPEYTFVVTGRPFRLTEDELVEMIQAAVVAGGNIEYHGNVNIDRYDHLLDGCCMALSLRDPADKEHLFNFPSKIIECLSFGKPVVSTIAYNDVPAGIVFYSEYTAAAVARAVRIVDAMTPAASQCWRRRVNEYMESTASAVVFSRHISTLFNSKS